MRAAGLALGPGRVALALLTLALMTTAIALPELWLSGEAASPRRVIGEHLERAVDIAGTGLASFDPSQVVRQLAAAVSTIAVDMPRALWAAGPFAAILVGVLALGLGAVGGGAIARSAAADLAGDRETTSGRALTFAAARARSLVGAAIWPIAAAGAIAGLIGIAEGLLLVPGLDVIAALLHVLALLLALLAVLLAALWVLGGWMLSPAVVCDGVDAIDAAQRSFAYVLGRPLRYVATSGVLLVLGAVLVGVLAAIASATVGVVVWAAGGIWGDEAAAILMGAAAEGTSGVASSIVGFWHQVVGVLVGAVAVSFFHCAGTAAYLTMRRACDGQAVEELWWPGMVERTIAESMRARAARTSAEGQKTEPEGKP